MMEEIDKETFKMLEVIVRDHNKQRLHIMDYVQWGDTGPKKKTKKKIAEAEPIDYEGKARAAQRQLARKKREVTNLKGSVTREKNKNKKLQEKIEKLKKRVEMMNYFGRADILDLDD